MTPPPGRWTSRSGFGHPRSRRAATPRRARSTTSPPSRWRTDCPPRSTPAYGELIDQDPAADPDLELAGPIETGLGIHLFYAIQWWLFIGIAVVGYFALLRRESREAATRCRR